MPLLQPSSWLSFLLLVECVLFLPPLFPWQFFQLLQLPAGLSLWLLLRLSAELIVRPLQPPAGLSHVPLPQLSAELTVQLLQPPAGLSLSPLPQLSAEHFTVMQANGTCIFHSNLTL